MRRWIFLCAGLALLVCLVGLAEAYAFHNDAFTYFIPYPADELDNQFDAANDADFIGVPIDTTISISVLHTNEGIYYDHWEDGLESNINQPSQPSTQVWGDGDPSNGVAPTVRQPNPGDTLVPGDIIALRNVVPVEPRDPALVLYDGGDKLVSQGGALAVSLAVWPELVPGEGGFIPGILFAGAWELYPTSRWGVEYVIPVGENVTRGLGSFEVAGLNVQAFHEDTLVEVDLDADGDFEISEVLSEGGQLTWVEGVNAGAQVRASEPVQVQLFTGDPDSAYEARAYTILPRENWNSDYLAPRSSDGDYWLYNPNENELLVTAATITGTSVITIPANGVAKYPPEGLLGATGVHFTADGDFYGIVALDDADAQDWGYALLPTANLTTQTLVGWAPGNNNEPPDGDESRVYVTAAIETTVVVDYNGDGTPDAEFPVVPLTEVAITDPTDNDMTGALLYSRDGTPFIAVWGQDETASPALPSIDVGTNIVPLPAPAISQDSSIVDSCTLLGPYLVDFELTAFNDSFAALPDVTVADRLPPEFVYVAGTTVMTTSDPAGNVTSRPIPDGGGMPFPLDGAGYNVGTVPGFGRTVITFKVTSAITGAFLNTAEIVSPPTDPSIELLELPFRVPGYVVNKTLIDPPGGPVAAGQVITFGLTLTNTSSATITELPLWDTYDENLLTFRSASLPPDSVTPGLATWTDLTISLGDLAPGASLTQTLSFSVTDPLPPGVTGTRNVALGTGVQDSQGRTQAIVCAESPLAFRTPEIELDCDCKCDQEPNLEVIIRNLSDLVANVTTSLTIRDDGTQVLSRSEDVELEPNQSISDTFAWTELGIGPPPKEPDRRQVTVQSGDTAGTCSCNCPKTPVIECPPPEISLAADCDTGTVRIVNPCDFETVDEQITVIIDGEIIQDRNGSLVDRLPVQIGPGDSYTRLFEWGLDGKSLIDAELHTVTLQTRGATKTVYVGPCLPPLLPETGELPVPAPAYRPWWLALSPLGLLGGWALRRRP